MNRLKYILSGLALAGGIAAQAQGNPNIYASELSAERLDGAKYKISFKLNADATNVKIKVLNGTEVAYEQNFGAKSKGTNAETIDLAGVGGVDMNWSIVAESAPNMSETAVKFAGDESQFQFNEARGVAVDNNMESPYFGHIYVSEANPRQGINKTDGIYIYDACLTDFTGQGNTGYAGGENWKLDNGGTGSGPMRLFVAEDGNVYITDWSTQHSGIWIMNPADPSSAFKPVFADGTRDGNGTVKVGGENVHGSISSCYVSGIGENTVLYTFDETCFGAGACDFLRYDIGTLENPWGAAPSEVVYHNAEKLQQNGNSVILPDGKGGWWLSQDRGAGANTKAIPSLMHIDVTGTVDYNSGITGFPSDTRRGALAISRDGSLMAVGCSKNISLYQITYGEDAPALTAAGTIAHGATDYAASLAFDVADNLYLTLGIGKGLRAWALTREDNSCETKASAKYLLEGDKSMSVESFEASRFGAVFNGNTLAVESEECLNDVSVFNLAGAAVYRTNVAGNSVEIDADGWQNGVYLVKVNNKTIKTIKK